MESNTEEQTDQSVAKKVISNRWIWLTLSLVLLIASGLVVSQAFQQSAELQEELSSLEVKLESQKKLADSGEELSASLDSCVEMVTTRVQQLDSFKSALSVVSAEYANMYHAGITNVNIDAYINALNQIADVTGVLDGQDLEACDAK